MLHWAGWKVGQKAAHLEHWLAGSTDTPRAETTASLWVARTEHHWAAQKATSWAVRWVWSWAATMVCLTVDRSENRSVAHLA